MKKILSVILACVMLFAITACSTTPAYENPVADDPNYVVWSDDNFTICFPKTMTIASENKGGEDTILEVNGTTAEEGGISPCFEVSRVKKDSLIDFSSAKDIDQAMAEKICEDAVAEMGTEEGMEISYNVDKVEYLTCGARDAAKAKFDITVAYPELDVSLTVYMSQYYIFASKNAYVVSFVAYDEPVDKVFADVEPYIFVD